MDANLERQKCNAGGMGSRYPSVKHWNHFVTASNGQRSTRTEICLYIDDYQCVITRAEIRCLSGSKAFQTGFTFTARNRCGTAATGNPIHPAREPADHRCGTTSPRSSQHSGWMPTNSQIPRPRETIRPGFWVDHSAEPERRSQQMLPDASETNDLPSPAAQCPLRPEIVTDANGGDHRIEIEF